MDTPHEPVRVRGCCSVWIGLLVAALSMVLVSPTLAQESTGETKLRQVTRSLAPLNPPPNIETPQACVENFVLSAREGDFDRAARSLNLRLLEPVTERDARRAAERLFFVLNQELWIDWEALPDRADGVVDRDTIGQGGPLVGEDRTGIRLGSISIEGRDVPIRLERVRDQQGDAVWLFSAQTVDNIESLYEAHGPSWLERNVPSWAQERWLGRVAVWKWITLVLTFALAPVIGFVLMRGLKKLTANVSVLEMRYLDPFDWPLAAVITTLILWLVIDWGLSLPSAIASVVDPIVLVALVASVTWLAMRVMNYIVEQVASSAIKRYHDEESGAQQRVLTQVTVARHVVLLCVALVGIGIVLLQLDVARVLGMTLLSSAGVAAVVFGIAGHAVLGNLIAGLQIAVTQPFKLGDSVYIEDNWGRIEDITYTYVVVRTWDERRLVLPIKYFIDHWFENWSLNDTFLVKPIYLKLDYRAPVDRIREQFLEFVKEDEDWDAEHDEPEVLVTDTEGESMVVRMTCGGATSGEAWSMSCRVREKMIDWLQALDDGAYLPRQRIELERAGS